MNNNDKKFIDNVINLEYNVSLAQEYIKEHFGVESEYDIINNKLTLLLGNINESLNIINAKDYLEDELENYVNIVY